TERRALGRTGLSVSPVTVGAAGWRHWADGSGPTRAQTAELLRRVVRDGRITVVDTSNNYGEGESERRIGGVLAELGGPPPGFLVQTKADRHFTGDFSGARMRESLRESRDRLGVDRLPVCYLHDPEHAAPEDLLGRGGAVEALLEARDEGLIEHLGVAGGPVPLLCELVRTGHFATLITHNRWTLVDRSADELLDLAAERGLGVFNAAPYGGGLLTAWPSKHTHYAYRAAPPALLAAADEIGRLCASAGVPLAAAALHWSLRDPRITSTIVGAASADSYERTLALSDVVVEDALMAAIAAVPLDERTWQDPRRGSA
uniref:aldo/keto reductase n=1 Tax=Amycolatopsis kentuckyensis TaxID=218823 RepID=UPI000A373D4C